MKAAATWYATNSEPLGLAPLTAEKRARICIIGGGFAGLATAAGLLERGEGDFVLLEAQEIARGASGRNGGFVFGGYSAGPEALVRRVGLTSARRLYQWTLEAVALIRSRIERYDIACELVADGVLLANWFNDDDALRRQVAAVNNVGASWQVMDRAAVRAQLRTDRYFGAALEPEAFHFHPLQYARGLARRVADEATVHEDSPALAVEPERGAWRVVTPRGAVLADEVVVAGGGYLSGDFRPLQRAMMPIATYVVASAPAPDLLDQALRTRAAVYDTRFAFDYYRRTLGDRLLWGGRIAIREPGAARIRERLRQDILRVYPTLRALPIEHAWGGWMSYARHEMPQIGRLPNGLWYAQAFGGHGVAPTTVAGEAIAEALLGDGARVAAFAPWGLAPTYGKAGRWAAQLTYWALQARDLLREWTTAR